MDIAAMTATSGCGRRGDSRFPGMFDAVAFALTSSGI